VTFRLEPASTNVATRPCRGQGEDECRPLSAQLVCVSVTLVTLRPARTKFMRSMAAAPALPMSEDRARSAAPPVCTRSPNMHNRARADVAEW
jgi:hypothetical protein